MGSREGSAPRGSATTWCSSSADCASPAECVTAPSRTRTGSGDVSMVYRLFKAHGLTPDLRVIAQMGDGQRSQATALEGSPASSSMSFGWPSCHTRRRRPSTVRPAAGLPRQSGGPQLVMVAPTSTTTTFRPRRVRLDQAPGRSARRRTPPPSRPRPGWSRFTACLATAIGSLRAGLWRVRRDSSISAILSQEPCLGCVVDLQAGAECSGWRARMPRRAIRGCER